MKTVEHISAATVRHNWKEIAEGVESGKIYIVENHGQPKAAVVSLDALKPKTFDVDEYFNTLMKQEPVPLNRVEITRSSEI